MRVLEDESHGTVPKVCELGFGKLGSKLTGDLYGSRRGLIESTDNVEKCALS